MIRNWKLSWFFFVWTFTFDDLRKNFASSYHRIVWHYICCNWLCCVIAKALQKIGQLRCHGLSDFFCTHLNTLVGFTVVFLRVRAAGDCNFEIFNFLYREYMWKLTLCIVCSMQAHIIYYILVYSMYKRIWKDSENW